MLERIGLTLLILCLTACGTFPLGDVHPQAGKSTEQQQLDTLTCKDQANVAVNSAGHQTGDFFLGMTIVGAPVAFELDKKKEREVFTACMQARGYTVTPADATKQGPSASSSPTPTPHSLPAIVINQLSLSPPEGFALRPIPDNLKSDGAVFYVVNRTLDLGAVIIPVSHEGIADLGDFAATRRSAQIDMLGGAVATDTENLEVGGHRAVRYAITGIADNVKLTYVTTIIEGQQELVIVITWSGATNAQLNMATMESLAGSVSGIL